MNDDQMKNEPEPHVTCWGGPLWPESDDFDPSAVSEVVAYFSDGTCASYGKMNYEQFEDFRHAHESRN